MRILAVLLALVCTSCGAAGTPYVPTGGASAVQGFPASPEPVGEPSEGITGGAAMDNPPMAGPGTCVKPDDPGCPTRLVTASRSQDCVTKTLEGVPQEVQVEFVSAAPVAVSDEAVTVGFPTEDSPLYREIPADIFLTPEDVDPVTEGHQVKARPDGTIRFFISFTNVRGAFDYFVTARGGTLREALGRDAVSEDPSCKPSFEGGAVIRPSPPAVNFNGQFPLKSPQNFEYPSLVPRQKN